MRDMYELCSMRFEKWFQCDTRYFGLREELAKKNEEYPCYKFFYEMEFACSDNMLDFLLELHYYRTVNHFNPLKHKNSSLTGLPTIFDTPSARRDISTRIK